MQLDACAHGLSCWAPELQVHWHCNWAKSVFLTKNWCPFIAFLSALNHLAFFHLHLHLYLHLHLHLHQHRHHLQLRCFVHCVYDFHCMMWLWLCLSLTVWFTLVPSMISAKIGAVTALCLIISAQFNIITLHCEE